MPEQRPVQIGWRNCSPQAALAFFAPEPVPPGTGGAPDALTRRLIQVRSPYNLTVRRSPEGVRPVRFLRVPEEGGLSEAAFNGLVTPIVPTAQRNGQVPAVQVSLNLLLVTEEDCAIHLMPPFLAPSFRDWPGTVVAGRFPLRAWPRPLNCVLEWQDADRDWVLRRGDPMVYLLFDFDDPAKVPEMVEAALTPALKRHFAQVDNVSSFGRNVGPMFQEAARRRPERLLQPKRIGCPDFS